MHAIIEISENKIKPLLSLAGQAALQTLLDEIQE